MRFIKTNTMITRLGILFVLCYLPINNAIAQVDLSPKGRIDILNDQKRQEEESKKDLIFKNSGPLRDVIAKHSYVSGEKICDVEISTSYFQAGDQAKVEAMIDHSQCGASNGKYTVNLKVQDSAGEVHTTKYKEVWSRKDDQAITAKHTYPLMESHELLKARIKLPSRDYCTCMDSE